MENQCRACLAIVLLVLVASAFAISGSPGSFRVPRGTPEPIVDAVLAAYNEPYAGVVGSIRPGGVVWAERTPAMERILAFGDRAVPILIANLGNERLKYTAVRALGDLKAEEAVPTLVDLLEMRDSPHDLAIMDSLSDITGRSSYHRFWFSDSVREEAVAEYTEWCSTNGVRPPKRKVDATARCMVTLRSLIDWYTCHQRDCRSGRPRTVVLTAPVNDIVSDFRRWLEEHHDCHLIAASPYLEADTVTLRIYWTPRADNSRAEAR